MERTRNPRLVVANRIAREKLSTESEEIRKEILDALEEEKKNREAAEEAAEMLLDGSVERRPQDYAEYGS